MSNSLVSQGIAQIRSTLVSLVAIGCAAPPSPPRTYIPTEQVHTMATRGPGSWSSLGRPPSASTRGGIVVSRDLAPNHAAAVVLVRRFFDAVTRSNVDAIRALSTTNAVAFDGRRERPLDSAWMARLRRVDYRALRERSVFWEPSISLFVGASDPAPNDAAPLRAEDQSIIVRVPIEPTQLDGQLLFGPVVWLQLEPTADGLKISGYKEDFVFE